MNFLNLCQNLQKKNSKKFPQEARNLTRLATVHVHRNENLFFVCYLRWYSSECVTRVKTHNKIENIRHCMRKIEILILFFSSLSYFMNTFFTLYISISIRVRSEARKEQQKIHNGEWVSSFSSPRNGRKKIMRSKIIFHAKAR